LGAVGPGVRPVALTPAKRYSKAMAKTNLEEGEWFMPAPEDACRTCGGRGVIGPVDQLSGLYDGWQARQFGRRNIRITIGW
jgi:hypothetical protein